MTFTSQFFGDCPQVLLPLFIAFGFDQSLKRRQVRHLKSLVGAGLDIRFYTDTFPIAMHSGVNGSTYWNKHSELRREPL